MSPSLAPVWPGLLQHATYMAGRSMWWCLKRKTMWVDEFALTWSTAFVLIVGFKHC
jgi:hypothetical protein